jgi:SPP1 family predicted phage head-tail adaptor
MKAGRRDRLLTFQRKSTTLDALGSETETWANIGQAWAERMDVSDGERWQAAQVQAQITTRFRVLRSDVTAYLTPRDRLICDCRTYDIQGLKEVAREGFEITANARAD